MKKEIIIISDIYGIDDADWVKYYQNNLSSLEYSIKFYDACTLAGVDLNPYTEKHLHKQFVEFGIQEAVDKLLKLNTERRTIIGCSVGGVIAWKAALSGLAIERLICISSTRLRLETQKPNTLIECYFGDNDLYKPDKVWFDRHSIELKLIKNGSHGIYKDELVIKKILQDCFHKQG